jgi:hypothetical protein
MKTRVPLLVLALVLSGCVTLPAPYRAHPELGQRLPAAKTLALLPPDVKVYQLPAGGVPELMDDWSALGKKNAAEAIRKNLGEQGGYTVKEFTPDPTTDPKLVQTFEEVRALVETVRATVLLHTYNPMLTLEDKRKNFRYSIGPVPELADATGADALVFVTGVDHISTAGRKALMVFGVLVGAASGIYVVPAGGVSQLTIAVIEPRTGDLLWFNIAGAGGGSDLRNPEAVAPLTKTLLTGFGKGASGP